MALDFPSSPSVDEEYTIDGVIYVWDGFSWNSKAVGDVTQQGNTFNGAGELVQLDGSGRLPAIDGSQLTNISGAGGGVSTGKAIAMAIVFG